MRARLRLTALLIGLAVALAGCGGDDAAEERRANQDAAEKTVRAYLIALIDKRGAEACAKFTPEYQRSVLRQNREFAREEGVDDCAGLLDAITRASPSVAFEGRPLTRDTVGDIPLKTSVRQSGEAHNATVTGAQGMQRYELETRDGRWLISAIERVG